MKTMGKVWAERLGLDNRTVADLVRLLESYEDAKETARLEPSEENAQFVTDIRLNVVAFLRRSGTLEDEIPSNDAIDFAYGAQEYAAEITQMVDIEIVR